MRVDSLCFRNNSKLTFLLARSEIVVSLCSHIISQQLVNLLQLLLANSIVLRFVVPFLFWREANRGAIITVGPVSTSVLGTETFRNSLKLFLSAVNHSNFIFVRDLHK